MQNLSAELRDVAAALQRALDASRARRSVTLYPRAIKTREGFRPVVRLAEKTGARFRLRGAIPGAEVFQTRLGASLAAFRVALAFKTKHESAGAFRVAIVTK